MRQDFTRNTMILFDCRQRRYLSRIDPGARIDSRTRYVRAPGSHALALSEIDRNLLERCLARRPGSWEDFVDRFLGLVTHVINHTSQARSIKLSPQDREDLSGDVFLAVIKDDFSLLSHFRGQCSLATYLTVVTR